MLVAGVGNALLGDDGFGAEVLQRLGDQVLPSWVQVADYGICGNRAAYELVGDYDTTILIDATPHGGRPGELYVREAELDGEHELLASHGLEPAATLELLRLLGGDAGRVYVVGCEPLQTEGFGLSEPVAAAVDAAVHLVTDLTWGIQSEGAPSVQPEAPRQLEPVRGE